MRLVKTRDQAIYDKLVRLAGGDARIVSQVVESSDNSEPMDLLQIVEQIKHIRDEQKDREHSVEGA
jgi:hypothetical protein